MKGRRTSTINIVAKIFCDAVKEVIEGATGSAITYAPTIQKVPSISLKPDIGCFVQFTGDYSGLFIMNLSGPAALEIYRRSMSFMGLPKEELTTDWFSDDVVNCIGEFINQIIGKARQKVEHEYGLTATNNQPKAISISSAINMSVATMLERPQCRRLSFRTEDNNPFYVEMNLEQTEFIQLEPVARGEAKDIQEHIDSVIEGGQIPGSEDDPDSGAEEDIDVDALLSQYGK